jgi:hypothetical protein
MPRWRVEMLPLHPSVPPPLEIVEAEGVAIGSGGALVFHDAGRILRALAPGQWAHLTLLEGDDAAAAQDRYTAATQAASG